MPPAVSWDVALLSIVHYDTLGRLFTEITHVCKDGPGTAARCLNSVHAAISTAFPQVLIMMSDKLDWAQKLGDAFLAQH
jgi:hypothetical protein